MRTYEFRTWDTKKKKMLSYLSQRKDGTTIVMQYIGQTDSQGYKIFESDLISWEMPELGIEGVGEVVYSETMASYVVLDTKQGISVPLYRVKQLCVIGNIYEKADNEMDKAI